ncbi:MAG: transglutaminase-like domain-containing protein [Planctomycetota bacterium]|nr:transglutaminase-like domain-containing protein [Planctomycetota bacterium]
MTTGPNKEPGTLLLVSLAGLCLTVARVPSCPSISWLLTTSICFITAPWIIWFVLRTYFGRHIDRYFPLVLAIWTVLPLSIELIQRRFGVGDLAVITMLVTFQNVALMLGAFSHHHRAQQIACLLAAFIVLFAVAIGTSTAVYIVAGLFGVMMLWWMMARYWERVQQPVIAGSIDRCLPLRSTILGVGAGLAALIVLALGSTSASTYVIRGFMPSSGGTPWTDDMASAGIGDGDALVAARDEAMTFGPVDSELFLDSEMPSLYDMVTEVYGEPIKIKKLKKSVALESDEVKIVEQKMAKSKRSGREFSTLRRQVERKRKTLDDRDADAMLYVVGHTPLHLALERFNTFNGLEWAQSELTEKQPTLQLVERDGESWLYWMTGTAAALARGLQPNAIKIINLKTDRIPSPPQLTAVHIHKVNRPDFFGWTDDSVLFMPERDHIPQLTVIHLRSQALNLQPLRDADFTASFPKLSHPVQAITSGKASPAEMIRLCTEFMGQSEVALKTALQWTANVPRGWQQVEAVVNRLRKDFQLDPDATAKSDCDDVVSHFLTVRRGPDYMFATTAAMLLRSLDYPTRLVTGFYAHPDRFDHRAGQTKVLPEDVHVWTEVYVGDGTWIAIEPTPGYEPPAERLNFAQWAIATAAAILEQCRRHSMLILLAVTGLVILFKTRSVWLAFMGNVVCRIMGMQSAEARIRWTLRLLAWQARLVGYRRPVTRTISSWYRPLLHDQDSETRHSLQRFFLWSERLLYSNLNVRPEDHYEISHACTVAAIAANPRRLRRRLSENIKKEDISRLP